jgi:tartrate-resistant acid phosphatase type 5
LQNALAGSSAPWKIVYMHHPPYSSGLHGPVEWTRWPYKEWGASVVLSGHDHTYERLLVDGFPYFVNGLGGGAIYQFIFIEEGSQVRYNEDYGAMLVEASQSQIVFQFINRQGQIIDSYTMTR